MVRNLQSLHRCRPIPKLCSPNKKFNNYNNAALIFHNGVTERSKRCLVDVEKNRPASQQSETSAVDYHFRSHMS